MLKHTQKANRGDSINRKIRKVFAHGETRLQEYLFFESPIHGTCLALDGEIQCCSSDEALYHEALVHPAMLLASDPKTILIVGGGEGATAREILRHPGVEKVVMVDLDQEFFDLCKEYMPSWGEVALNDPRVEIHHQDINVFLKEHEAKFDVVIGDLIEVHDHDSPEANMYGVEFYSRLKDNLNPGAIIATQAGPLVANDLENHLSVRHKIQESFEHVYSYGMNIPSLYHLWGYVLISDDDLDIKAEKMLERFTKTAKERDVIPPACGILALSAAFSLPSVIHRQFKIWED